MPSSPCPCGSDRPLALCCGAIIDGALPASAESLMRSRYTAYSQLGGTGHAAALAWLLASWHASTRPVTVEHEPGLRWLGLRIKSHRGTGPNLAEVGFVARYRVGGASAQRLAELSRFVCEDGRWFYIDGSPLQER